MDNLHVVPPFYGVYLLQSTPKPKSIYIGSTPDPGRRLRQHNGELKQGGAYRTKRDGYRPWQMALIVSGFPSRVSALQFEHALQHPYRTRHIAEKLSSKSQNQRSLHYKLANLRLLLNSVYFLTLSLQVNILTDDMDLMWNENKHLINVDTAVHKWPDFADFAAKVPDFYGVVSHTNLLIAELVSVSHCGGCDKEIDMVVEGDNQIPLVTKCLECDTVFHLGCFTNELLPKYVDCPRCEAQIEWFKMAAIATKTRKHYCARAL